MTQLLSIAVFALLYSGHVLAQSTGGVTVPITRSLSSRPRVPRPPQNPVSYSDKLYSLLLNFEGYLSEKQRLRSSQFDVNIQNAQNIEYNLDIYVGSNNELFKVQMDTGSNKLILIDKSCDGCASKLFDSAASTSFVNTGTEDSIEYLDGSRINGFTSTDSVALDAAGTYKATAFHFLLGTDTKGFESQEGLIGLTRKIANDPYPIITDELKS